MNRRILGGDVIETERLYLIRFTNPTKKPFSPQIWVKLKTGLGELWEAQSHGQTGNRYYIKWRS